MSDNKPLRRDSEDRRVSFSAYRGPSESEQKQPGGAAQETSTGEQLEEQSSSALSRKDVRSPVPRAQAHQHHRSSQLGIPRRSPPTRPVGDPPGDGHPAGELRRYSIFNEKSRGAGGFSRRMSTMENPNPTNGSGAKAEGTSREASERDITGAGTGSSTSAPPGKPLAPDRDGTEPRSTVLWYNMGVTKQKGGDPVGAVECYTRAAREGHSKARHNLAAIYEKGAPGVPKDDARAVHLFRLAADQGLAESCYSLAMHFKFGLGEDRAASNLACSLFMQDEVRPGCCNSVKGDSAAWYRWTRSNFHHRRRSFEG